MSAVKAPKPQLPVPRDPAGLSYPPGLPVEVALGDWPLSQICEAHGITREAWNVLRFNEVFRKDVKDCLDALKNDGMSFKLRARLQSEELLKTSWRLIHDTTGEVPPSVKADMIKHTHRVAGLVPANNPEPQQTTLQQAQKFEININL